MKHGGFEGREEIEYYKHPRCYKHLVTHSTLAFTGTLYQPKAFAKIAVDSGLGDDILRVEHNLSALTNKRVETYGDCLHEFHLKKSW